MNWIPNFWAIMALASALCGLIVVALSYRRRDRPATPEFMGMILGVAIWSLGTALALGSQNSAAALWGLRIASTGNVIVYVAGPLFVMRYLGLQKWITPLTILLLCTEPAATLVISWNNLNGWMYLPHDPAIANSYLRLDLTRPYTNIELLNGTWFWIDAIWGWFIFAACVAIVFRAIFIVPQEYRKQGLATCAGLLIPLAANLVHELAPEFAPGLDLTVVAFLPALLLFIWAISRQRLLDIVPMAYTNIIENMPDAVFILSAQNKIQRLNPAAEKLLGKSAADLLGQSAETIFAADPGVLACLHNIGSSTELCLQFGDYEQRDFETSIAPLYQAQNKIAGQVITMRDITGRKKAEKALYQAEARNRAILGAIPDLMFRISRDGVFLDYRVHQQSDLYVPPDAFIGKNISENMPPDLTALTLQHIHATLESGEVQVFEYTLPFPTGSRDFEARISASGKEEVVVIVRNITERKHIEQEREELIAELQKALTEIKTLQGILPICVMCKKIRDDAGSWTQLERYISEHSEADFSHGYCPDCFQKAMAELELFKSQNKGDKP